MRDLNETDIPKHIAIIMDGNGRWAKSKGKLRVFGHKNGIKSVRETVEYAAEIGIKYLTLYAFSTENWKRPISEINSLMSLLITAIEQETSTLIKNQIKLSTIGEIDKLPNKTLMKLNQITEKTSHYKKMNLILALSYGGRKDIISAVKRIVKNNIPTEKITTELFKQYLSTKNVPDPELLIRTSGEYRISNFLLWEVAYSELYFTKKLWPDFRKEDLKNAIFDYQNRERRFGDVK
tara:strand:- start:511 stop:1218 length:708 start_codon:yes stop_codon:yes gene_type:complete